MRIEITDEYFLKILERAEKITSTDYERKGNFIPLDSLLCMIRDLEEEIDYLEEKIEDTEDYYHDNYRPIPASQMYGVSESDFH